MECELCGRECSCKPAEVDGVRMMLCPGCLSKHGHGVKPVSTPKTGGRPILSRIKKPKEKDVYKNMDKVLISNYSDEIKEAREKKGLSREDLGFRVGERTVTISKIENKELRPSDKTIKKLEKELNISLMEEIKKARGFSKDTGSKTGLTLGDFIKKEEK